MEKSNLLQPTSIVAAADILAWSVNTHSNTLRCVEFYSTSGVVKILTMGPGLGYDRRVAWARTMGCKDEWPTSESAGQ